jgi:AraC family transcriptional regulator
MNERFRHIQPLIEFAASYPDADLSLETLAGHSGFSPFHLHRMFLRAAGETPKAFTLRVRLSRAAALLLSGEQTVLNVALECGFHSHETFSRAFKRQFGMTPRAYRERGFTSQTSSAQAKEHARLVAGIGPCVGFYRAIPGERKPERKMTYSVTRRDLAPQPVLLVRRTVKRSEIASTIADVLPKIFQYALQNGMALRGHPLTRYVEVGPGLVTIEPAMRVAAGGTGTSTGAGPGEVVYAILPGGAAASTTHFGKYEDLHEAYAAIEQWMKAAGISSGGAPWEDYVTDPAESPDPGKWRTDVYWPLAE